MGRPCDCCNRRIIAWIGSPLFIFSNGIYINYSTEQENRLLYYDGDDLFGDGKTWEENVGNELQKSPLRYQYVEYNPYDYNKYDGITIGSHGCGDMTTGFGDYKILNDDIIIESLKSFIREKKEENFIFWHSEWNNFLDFQNIPPGDFRNNYGCFSINHAIYYTEAAKKLGLSLVFKSDTTSPNSGLYDPDFGLVTHDRSIPFLRDFSDNEIFLTNATGKCDGISPIGYAKGKFKYNGECLYYQVLQSGVKLVVVADSNFCRLDPPTIIKGNKTINPFYINPLFARALIQFAGRSI